jgi:hypothetical protein
LIHAAVDGVQSRQEFLDFERLGHIVIGPRPQPRHAIAHLSPSSQHKHGKRRLPISEATAEFEPLAIRKHPVEDDDIKRSGRKCLLGRLQCSTYPRFMSLLPEYAFQKFGNLNVVFDDEKVHEVTLHPVSRFGNLTGM